MAQLQLLANEVEEMVVAREEIRLVVTQSEIQLGLDDRMVATGNVIRHEVKDYLQLRVVSAPDQCLELSHALAWVRCEVGADVEIIPDGVHGAGNPLDNVRIVGGHSQRGIICQSRLAQATGEPNMRGPETLDA